LIIAIFELIRSTVKYIRRIFVAIAIIIDNEYGIEKPNIDTLLKSLANDIIINHNIKAKIRGIKKLLPIYKVYTIKANNIPKDV
jgi:hypothetical protein